MHDGESPSERASPGPLTDDDLSRYSRHILLPEIGTAGQTKLKSAKVLVIGTGGLSSPVCLYLAAAGVGTIGLVEFDVVDRSNLQRQILFSNGDLGRSKLQAALERLRALAPSVTLLGFEERLTATNALELIKKFDVVVDGSDNFATRYLVNDACVLLGRPNVHGSIYRFDGQASVFSAPGGPCYRCLFPAPPPAEQAPSCAEGGVLGVLPGMIGMVQATEALKLILGIGSSLAGRLLIYDALAMRFQEFAVPKNPTCAICSDTPRIFSLAEGAAAVAASCELPSSVSGVLDIEPRALAELRRGVTPPTIVDVRSAGERQICRIKDSLHVPMDELAERLCDFSKKELLIVYCKSGARSSRAVTMLQDQGFTDVKHLRGGILKWIADVEPSLPVY